MEQSSGKKARLILAAGLLLALTAAGLQYLSPVSREIMSGRDVRLVLPGERSSLVLLYHPFSGAVNAFTVRHRKFGEKGSYEERARRIAAPVSGEEGPVFFLDVSDSPSLEPLWRVLNNWRAEPRLLLEAGAWALRARSSLPTNLTGFDVFAIFSELASMNSSDFILTEFSRRSAAAPALLSEPSASRRVEVFNAAGVNGLAGRTSKRLRELGFDVITVSSKPRSARTSLISFSRDTSVARDLQKALGLGEIETRIVTRQKSIAAAAVILGEDFAKKREK